MNTSVEGVAVRIDADDRGLKAGLNDALKEIDHFSGRAKTAFTVLGVAIAGFTAAMAAIAVGSGFGALKKVADELEDIAIKASTIGLMNKELQEFEHIARRVDVEAQAMANGLQKFAIYLGQARTGSGPLVNTLQVLAPELLNTLKHTTDVGQAMLILSDYVKGLTSEQDKLAIAQAAFSRGGVDLVRVLKLGSEGIKELAKEGNELDFIFSNEMINRGSELSDQIEEVSKAFNHQLSKALIEISPLLVNVINFAVQLAASIRGITHAIGEAFTTTAAEKVKGLSTKFNELSIEIEGLQAKAPVFGGSTFTDNLIKQRQVELENVRKELELAKEDLQQAQQDAARAADGQMGPFPAPSVAEPRDLAEEQRLAEEARTERQKLHNAEIEKYLELRKQQLEIESSLDPVWGRLAERMDELSRAQQKGIIDTETWSLAMSKAVAIAANGYADAASSIAKDLGKVFEGNKSVAIATALINTFQAVTNAWANVPWPLNIAAAAAALAAGMTQVANIRSTTKSGGGGGGGAATSSGGGITQVPQTLTVQGLSRDEFFSGAQIGPLVQQLLKYQQDGGTVVIQQ